MPARVTTTFLGKDDTPGAIHFRSFDSGLAV
jgi:hypothetical protein